jgi:altronate hydrolase
MLATKTAPTTTSVVRLHPDDNICIASSYIPSGATIDVQGQRITVPDAVRLGHKIAMRPIAKGQPVRKYGQIIGFTTESVKVGECVHSHNLAMGEFERDPAPSTQIPPPPTPITGRTFQGYRRANGKAGTRNYLAVISTVNCSASVSKYVSRRFDTEVIKRDFPNIDGVIGITHQSGCAMQYAGMGHQMLARVLGGVAKHPNVGAYLLIGLGCETATMGYLLDHQRLVQINGTNGDRRMPPVFSMQDQGGTTKTVEAAVKKILELLPIANDVRREPIPASELILATECGGSDGNSGITANPALGVAADMVVACGGTAILSETTEIYGAEHLLTRRAVSPAVAQKLLDRIEWWKWYTGIFGADMDNNPSSGNKEGGLTTIAEKSLGAVAKGGSTALVDVYQYAEEVAAKGFVIMDTPGYDPASVVGLVAGGANMIVFTTGRGSCFGCKPVPSIKVATNTPMYERMIDDMDINAGEILNGQSVEQVGREIFEQILEVASGKQTKSEIHGIGEEEFVPWFVGPTL